MDTNTIKSSPDNSKDKLHKSFVLCKTGIVLGFVFAVICIWGLIFEASNPINPHAIVFVEFYSYIGVFVYSAAGFLAVILLSLSVIFLIHITRKTHKKPYNKSTFTLICVLLPCILLVSWFSGSSISYNIKQTGYRDPVFTYKNTEFSYYIGTLTTSVTGIAPNTPVPKKLVLPDKVKGKKIDTIYKGAFKNNKTITEVVIPNTIEYIGEDAFRGCRNLKKVTLSKKIHKIRKNAFKDCTALSDINEPPPSVTKKNRLIPYVYNTYTCEIDKTSFDGCPNAPKWTRNIRYINAETTPNSTEK